MRLDIEVWIVDGEFEMEAEMKLSLSKDEVKQIVEDFCRQQYGEVRNVRITPHGDHLAEVVLIAVKMEENDAVSTQPGTEPPPQRRTEQLFALSPMDGSSE